MSVAAAAAASTLLGFITVADAQYRYWMRWAGRRALWVALAGQALAYAACGIAVAALTLSSGWRPAGHDAWLANGALYGAVAQGVIRMQTQVFDMEKIRDPQTTMSRIASWITRLLDNDAGANVKDHVHRMSDEVLIERAFDLFWTEVDPDPEVDERQGSLVYANLKSAREALEKGGDLLEARGILRGFCQQEIIRRQLWRKNL